MIESGGWLGTGADFDIEKYRPDLRFGAGLLMGMLAIKNRPRTVAIRQAFHVGA